MTITDTHHDPAPPDPATVPADVPTELADSPPCEPDDVPNSQAGTDPGPPAAPQHELVHIDPAELVLGDNIRIETAISRAFVSHLRDRGLLQPITARRRPDGRLLVRTGHRRTLAAVRAGLATVPVVVLPQTIDDDTAREIDRIVEQLGENQHRDALTDLDEVTAHQQLFDLGLTAGQIAHRTRTPRKRVQASVAVGQADQARQAMARLSLTLDQAVILAEFDDDPDAVAELSKVVTDDPARLDHAAQRLRDRRTEARARAEAAAQLTDRGITVIDRPERLFGGPVRSLNQLRATPDTPPGRELTEAEHTSCPGHSAWIEFFPWKPEDERTVTVYACADWPAHGHAELRAPEHQATEPDPGPAKGPWTEQQKAERREVIANNKLWDSATTVRRTWLRQFAARRTPPQGATLWIAQALATGDHSLRTAMEKGHPLGCRLLGLTGTQPSPTTWYHRGPEQLATLLHTASPQRATVVTLTLLLGAMEDATSRSTWRGPSDRDRHYFATLRDWGYPLAEVEQLVLDRAENGQDDPSPTTDQHIELGADSEPYPAQADATTASDGDGTDDADGTTDDPTADLAT